MCLPSRVFDLLAHLLRHHDLVVDKDALMRAGWADISVTEDSLTHGISILRHALGEDSANPRFIVTLPRRGYQFVGPVEELGGSGRGIAPSPAGWRSPTNDELVEPRNTDTTNSPRGRAWLWGAGAAVVAICVTLAKIWGNQDTQSLGTSQQVIQLSQVPPTGSTLVSGGLLSPDGRQIAFVARDYTSGKRHLWVRRLSSSEPTRVKDTEGASKPFWSPRGDALGYFVANMLMVASLTGDPAREIASGIVNPSGGTWGEHDRILFADSGRGIFEVAAAGGKSRQVTAIEPESELNQAWPNFLPGGQRFLYAITSRDSAKFGTWISSLDAVEHSRLLVPGITGAVYSPSGHLLYTQNNSLVAVPFDYSEARIRGVARVVAQNVPRPQIASIDPVSAAGNVLSYTTVSPRHQLTWFSRSGERLDTLPTRAVHNPVLSLNGRLLAVTGLPSIDPGLWIVDLDRNAATLMDLEGIGPVTSPDGTQVAYTVHGGLEIRVRNLVGQTAERTLLRDGQRKTALDWSPDGRNLVFSRLDAKSGLDIWMLRLDRSADAVPLLTSPSNERQARISPDGSWIAYTSDESGTLEVYVQEFPHLGSKRVLSIGGGAGPAWRRDGGELFYLSIDRRLMSVEFGSGGVQDPARAAPLFNPPLASDVWQARNYYAVSQDGQRFLFNAADETEGNPITIMINWLTSITVGS